MSLINVPELAERLRADTAAGTVVCDVRFYLGDLEQGRREYAVGHIPGAVFVDLHTQLAAPAGASGGRHPLPPCDTFAATLGELGIGADSFVVAYDAAGGAMASRLWWMLRSIGHGQVAVLDGGYPAWLASAQPVSSEPTVLPERRYPPVSGWTGVVDADAVSEAVALGATIVDARAPERYRGDVEPIDARAGHIPSAINRYHADNLASDGVHLPLAELAQRFSGIGESPIVYCGSGVTACHDLLAMSLVGISRARLYAGSWSDWSSDPGRPIATNDQP